MFDDIQKFKIIIKKEPPIEPPTEKNIIAGSCIP